MQTVPKFYRRQNLKNIVTSMELNINKLCQNLIDDKSREHKDTTSEFNQECET